MRSYGAGTDSLRKTLISIIVMMLGVLCWSGLLLLLAFLWIKLLLTTTPSITASIADLGILLVMTIAIPLLLVAVGKQFLLWRGSAQFILETFKDASGYEFSQDQLLSVSMDMWQQLAENVSRIGHRVNHHKETDSMTTFAPLPKGVGLEMEKKLVNADEVLAKYGPEKMTWLLPLMNYLLPVRSVRVSCSMRCIRGFPAFTFSIVDTIGKTKPEVYTVCADIPLANLPKGEILNKYHQILPRVLKSLALEICKYEMLAQYPWKKKSRPKKPRQIWEKQNQQRRLWKSPKPSPQAQMYNFFGILYALYQRAYERPGMDLLYKSNSIQDIHAGFKLEESFFYKQAVHNFEKAIKYGDGWDFPYANLADIHSLKGQHFLNAHNSDKDRAKNENLQKIALSEYKQALKKYTEMNGIDEDAITLRMEVSKIRAMLLSGDRYLRIQAIYNIEFIRDKIDIIVKNSFKSTQKETDVEKSQVVIRMLYYIACCCAMASSYCGDDIVSRDTMRRLAYRYLAYSLAMNVEGNTDIENLEDEEEIEDLEGYYWQRAASDPDFWPLHSQQSNFPALDMLKELLLEKLRQHIGENGQVGRLTTNEIEKVVGVIEERYRNRSARQLPMGWATRSPLG